MKTRTRWILLAGVVGAIAVTLWRVTVGARVEVEVAQLRSDTLSTVVEEEGRTRARDRFVVAAPVTGRLSRPRIEGGEPVETGAVVAHLAPAPEDPRAQASARAAVDGAEAQARQAQIAVDEALEAHRQAVREAERRRPLLARGALSRETVEQFERAAEASEARLESARAGLAAAEAALRRARARLMGTPAGQSARGVVEVRSPVAGRVLRVIEKSERVVPAGTPLVEIADVEGLEVVVDLLTEDAVSVDPGDAVRISGWGGEAVIEGVVDRVEPSAYTKISTLGVEEQRVDVVVALSTVPPELGDGYRVDAAIVTWRGTDVPTIPSAALFRRPSGWHVFVVADSRARERAIRIGHRGAERVEVLDGLGPEDRVILFPSDLVGEGARVSPRDGG